MFFFRKKRAVNPPQNKIEVFIRHTNFSKVSAHKKRPIGFDRKICYENLLKTADERVNFTFLLDTAFKGEHFIQEKAIQFQAGCEAASFLKMLEIVKDLDCHPDTLIYFLEDDYLHRKGWVDALFEAFSLECDYVTLYDHADKYRDYPKLLSKIFVTKTCHWRTTPSTTNTYAMRFSTLLKDYKIHQKFSLGQKVSKDHDKFCFLRSKGRVLISSIPGFATHADPENLSPCIEWDFYQKEMEPLR